MWGRPSSVTGRRRSCRSVPCAARSVPAPGPGTTDTDRRPSFYVMLDVYSRYVVGWMIAHRKSASLADTLIRRGARRRHCAQIVPFRAHSSQFAGTPHARRCDGFSLRDGPTRTSDIRRPGLKILVSAVQSRHCPPSRSRVAPPMRLLHRQKPTAMLRR